MGRIAVTRSLVRLSPDPGRVITKPYLPEGFAPVDSETRVHNVVRRVLELDDDVVDRTLDALRKRFVGRHFNLDEVFETGFREIAMVVDEPKKLSTERRLVIGAYFSHEYSIEGAALTNPSIAPHPIQSDVPDGSLRVIVTVRAVGEGHRSSIEFRTGLIDPSGEIEIDPAEAPMLGERRTATFHRELFGEKLHEMGEDPRMVAETFHTLGPAFSMGELDSALTRLTSREEDSATLHQFIHATRWVASSNYELTFPSASDLSGRVLFPHGPTDSHGMEDARLVRFVDDDGSVTYYATYTAYDGFNILPQLISTTDFETFRIATLNGRAATNKGIALFPRRVGGQFMALARSDGESNFLMRSDDVRRWEQGTRFEIPTRPWDLLQLGNCGSPIETEAGWLVITHGVGPMRQYSLGAMLLDLDEPERVIGDLEEPLLESDEDERDGYVPNVVYSCGAVVHNGHLVVPYGASDTTTRFATVEIDTLLSAMSPR